MKSWLCSPLQGSPHLMPVLRCAELLLGCAGLAAWCLSALLLCCSYDLMCRCWHPEPKLRPSFGVLRSQLEMIRGRMSTLSLSQDPLYVNIGKDKESSVSDPAVHTSFGNTDGDETIAGAAAAAITSDYRYIMSPLCLGDDVEGERHPEGQEGENKSLLYELETEGEKSC